MKSNLCHSLASLALTLLISLGITGCFDIREEFFIKKDGSGYATFTYDMSKMFEFIAMMGGEEGGGKDMEDLRKSMNSEEYLDPVRRIPGISDVEDLSESEKGIISYKLRFDNLQALSEVLANDKTSDLAGMGGGGEAGSALPPNKFTLNGKKFERFMAIDKLMESMAPDEQEQMSSMGAMMFGDATYSVNYQFEQKVKKVSLDGATISADGHSVQMERNMGDLFTGKTSMSHTIKLK